MLPGTPSGNYPSAPKRCAVQISTNSAVIFGPGPKIKGPIKIGKTYSGSSTYKTDRTKPGFRDPGGAFGGNAAVQSLEATYRLTVKILSAKRVRVTASGTTIANVLYRDPASPDNNPRYLPGTFTCRGTYSGTIARGRY